MELSSIIHEVSSDYIYKVNKDIYLFKLKAKKDDVKYINFHYKEKYTFFDHPHLKKEFNIAQMNKVSFDEVYDIFEIIVEADYIAFIYYFEIFFNDGNKIIYQNYIFNNEFKFDDFAFVASRFVLDTSYFDTPDWAKHAIVYQIFPDRFASSKMSLDEWKSLPEMSLKEMGGDLNGIKNRIPYIKSLGVNCVYLCPIFESESYHKYSTTDYLTIDHNFGTNEDFKSLVEEFHKNDIKVIIDLVFNHSGINFSKFIEAQNDKNTAKTWYLYKENPIEGLPPYETFGYHRYMPKLNSENKIVRDYLLYVTKYWYEYANIDGYRLDVADEISHNFWMDFRKLVKGLNKDLLIVGERWLESKSFLYEQWDSHMNYLYRTNIIRFIHNEITPIEFVEKMNFLRGFYNINAYKTLWNLLDSHDMTRYSYFIHDKKDQRNAVILQFLEDGAPFMYYGDEIGMISTKDGDIYSRQPMNWDESSWDIEMLNFYKKIIKIKKEFLNIFDGDKEYIEINDKFICYKKYDSYKNNFYYVLINNSDNDVNFNIGENTIELINDIKFNGIIKKKSIYILKKE